MKRKAVIVLIVFIIVTLSTVLSACNKEDDAYILAAKDEVASISVYLPESQTDFTLSGDELNEMISVLRAQPKLTKEKIKINVGKEKTNHKAINSITINTKKRFMKKARSYKVMVGVRSELTDTWGNKDTKVDENALRTNDYYGDSDGALKTLVKKIVEREDAKYSLALYNKIKTALQNDGYTLTPIAFDSNIVNRDSRLHTSMDIDGFNASKAGANHAISVILCNSVENAKARTKNYHTQASQGLSEQRIYWGASGTEAQAAYKKIEDYLEA